MKKASITAAAVFLGLAGGACTVEAVAAFYGANSELSLFNEEKPSVEELQARLVRLNAQAQGIRAGAEDADREFTNEEETQLESIQARFEATAAQLSYLDTQDSSVPRTAQRNSAAGASPVATARRTNPELGSRPTQQAAGSPRMGILVDGLRSPALALFNNRRQQVDGWPSDGDFFRAAANGVNDPRLFSNATGVEGVGVDGGFAVPPGFYGGVIDLALQEAVFAPKCRVFSTPGNSMSIPMPDVRDRSAGSIGGITANWSGENQQQTAQKLKWIATEMKLNKTFILAEASSELIEDGPAYVQYLMAIMAAETAYRLDAAILAGTGVGMPLGLLNSPGTIVVPAESGQAAGTIVYDNLVKMYARLSPHAQKNGTWFISPDAIPSMLKMVFPGSTNPVLINLTTGGAANAVGMMLFGRPVEVTEVASQLGSPGDIVFADMTQYALLLKNGARVERTNALGFDRDVIDWRFILRVGGTPLFSTPVKPWNGGATTSWASTLALRP